jgi:tRNA pseudouridine65 synthase
MKVLFQDASLLIVHKPEGLKVYRDSRDEPESLTDQIQSKVMRGQIVFPVHRLDAPTCGLVIFAKSAKVANLLQKKFQEGQIQKTYIAIVYGSVPSPRGRITHPLKHPKTKQLQKAVTEFEVLDQVRVGVENYTVLRVTPLTGRFHQIRRHLDTEGFPIVGDPVYGKKKRRSMLDDRKKAPPPEGAVSSDGGNPFRRMALSAVSVDFVHPVTKKRVQVSEMPEAEFGKWVKKSRR